MREARGPFFRGPVNAQEGGLYDACCPAGTIYRQRAPAASMALYVPISGRRLLPQDEERSVEDDER